jgi:sigma-E factor negative regulatory protein RseB
MMHLHHKVSALIDGELQGSARRRAIAHLRHCEDCRHELEATAALKRRLLGMPPAEPSADLFASLEVVTTPADAGQQPSATRGPSHVRRLVVGAGSLSLAVMSLAYVVGAPEPGAVASVRPPVDEANADFVGAMATHPLADPAIDTLLGSVEPSAPSKAGPGSRRLNASGLSLVAVRPGPPPGDDPRAVAALERAADAPRETSYRATRDVETYAGGRTQRVHLAIAHVPEQGTVYRILDADADIPAIFIDRSGDGLADGLDDDSVALLSAAYDIGITGDQKWLDRSATVVSVGRGGALVAELWIDDATGLILRRDLYEGGRLVRSSSLTRLQVLPHAFLLHLPPELDIPRGSTTSTSAAPSWNDQGWTCPGSVGAVFSLTGLGQVEAGGDAMVARYSDGLSHVSIFEQRGSLSGVALAGFESRRIGGTDLYVDYGLPTMAVWESDGTVYTLVTDAPPAQADDVVSDLPHAGQAAGDDLWSRLGNGFSELAGAVAP